MVAATCHWDDQTKLVNTASRLSIMLLLQLFAPTTFELHGADDCAESAIHPCPHIQVVQSSCFHERKHGHKKNVDSYAQDLCKLFYQAYASSAITEGEE